MKHYKRELKKYLTEINYNNVPYREVLDGLDNKDINRMIISMLELLDIEVRTFDYTDGVDVTYLFVLLDLLPELAQNKIQKKIIVKELVDAHKTMKNHIEKRPSEMDVVSLPKYKILKNLIAKLEDTALQFYVTLPKDYDSSKEEFISYLIFKMKNYSFYEAALARFPYIVNSKDKDGKLLIDRVVESYLDALDKYLADINLGPIDDLIYFNKIVKNMISSPKLKITKEDKERLLNKVKDYIASKHYESNRQNEKLTYFANNLFFIITNKTDARSIKDLDYEYEVHPEFKAANLSEAKRIYILHRDIKGPENPRRIYTFDCEEAFELDDGLALRREDGLLKLTVVVSNPPGYIPENSILRTEAIRRTRSLYYGDSCNPMFPLTLSRDLMSLNTKGYKNVMCFHFDFDELSGTLVNFNITNEIVSIYRNATYEEFDHELKNPTDPEYYEFLQDLVRVSSFMEREFHETTEYKALHNDNSKNVSTNVNATIMLFTGYSVAKLFHERSLPFIFRCHFVDPEKIKEINALKERMLLYSDNEAASYLEQLKNIYPRAFYSTTNVGHVGLGVPYASHITSGLRRSADDADLRAISTFILNPYSYDDVLKYQDEFARIAGEINSKRDTLDDYEIERAKLYVRKYGSKKHKP